MVWPRVREEVGTSPNKSMIIWWQVELMENVGFRIYFGVKV